MERNDEFIKDCAVATILNIWNCIDWEKIDKKRLYNIWDEFTNKVKSSAMTTNKYEGFVERLCKKMNIESLKYRDINDIEQEDDETKKKILKLIREETLSIVLQCKMKNEVIKEELKLKKEKEKEKNDKN